MSSEITNEQSTVQKILDAAGQVFAEVGFGAARVDEIAKRANVNKATIYYHIGGKETLYGKVLQHVFEHVVTAVSNALEESHTPEESIRLYVRHLSLTIQTQAYMPELMMRELASGVPHLPEPAIAEFGYLLEMLTGILEEGERQGVFSKSAPLLVHFMIIGSNLLLKTSKKLVIRYNSPSIEEMKRLYNAGMPEDPIEELEELVLRALKA